MMKDEHICDEYFYWSKWMLLWSSRSEPCLRFWFKWWVTTGQFVHLKIVLSSYLHCVFSLCQSEGDRRWPQCKHTCIALCHSALVQTVDWNTVHWATLHSMQCIGTQCTPQAVHWVKGTGGDQGTQASPSTELDTSPASACSSSSHTPVWSSKYFGSNVQNQPLLSRVIHQFYAQNPNSHPALFLILENVQDLHTWK